MQVFLPYPSYEWSLRSLDTQRLLKQVVEAYQLIKTSLGLSIGHTHHPVRIPFHDRVGSLVGYTVGLDRRADLGITPEWLVSVAPDDAVRVSSEPPWMIGEPAFHLSHQFSLAAKRPDTYAPLFGMRARCAVKGADQGGPVERTWGDPGDPEVRTDVEPYAWPVTDPDGVRWFQIGTKTERGPYAYLFDADPDLRLPLLVTTSEATARLERDHPRVLANYRARLASYAIDPSPEVALEHQHAEQLALRRMSWPAGADVSAADLPTAQDVKQAVGSTSPGKNRRPREEESPT